MHLTLERLEAPGSVEAWWRGDILLGVGVGGGCLGWEEVWGLVWTVKMD